MFKRFIALILVSILALASLAGCRNSPAGGKQEAQPEKVLTVASNMNLTTMEPWKSTSSGDFYIFYQIYSRLVESDGRGKYYPDLAESWECAEDGKTWTFHLSEDFKWQRGNELFKDELVPVTAQDVKYTMEYIMDPANACSRLEDLRSVIDSIEVVDDHTIRVVTGDIDVLLLYKLAAICIMPERAGEKGFDLESAPVGSGPFKWDSNIIDTQVVLTANEDYFIKPNIDKVIYRFVTESSVAAMALSNKEVDLVTTFAYSEMPTIKDCDFIDVYGGNSSCRWMGMNVTRAPFDDVRVRKAVTSYIDLEALLAAAYPDDGTGVVQAVRAYGQIPPENPGGDQERAKAATLPYSVENGDRYMTEAGWKKNSSGIWEKDGKTLSFELQVGTNDPVRLNCSVLIATMLNSCGFDCVTTAVEWGTHIDDMDAGRCDMFIDGGFSGIDGPMKVMHTDSTGIFSPNPGYSDPDIDALLEKAWTVTDDAAREELIMQAQERWIADCVYVPMYFAYNFQAYNGKKISDFYVNGANSLSFALTSRLRNVDINTAE
ncbi:MAG: ABC transporter substrate-binding protein [Firmicutes bacterium]|nr:ABC transporter substrate-binding protein [Bacillota bacterium]